MTNRVARLGCIAARGAGLLLALCVGSVLPARSGSAQQWGGWVSLGFPPGGIRSELTVARNQDGRLELFAVGSDDALWHAWQASPNGGWTTWQRLGAPAGVHLRGTFERNRIGVGENQDGRLEVFVASSDGLWQIWQQTPNGGWSDWNRFYSPPGVTWSIADLRVGRNADGRLELFVKNGGDGQLWQTWQGAANDGWSGTWHGMLGPGGGSVTRGFAVGLNADGREEVLTIGSDDALWHATQLAPNAGWSNWSAVAGTAPGDQLTVLDVVPNLDGRLEFFAAGTSGIWHTWQTGPGAWSGAWHALGTPPQGRRGGFATARNPDGRLSAFTWGGDFRLWQIGQIAANTGWGNWAFVNPRVDVFSRPDLHVGRNEDGRLEVFTYGAANTVWHIWQTSVPVYDIVVTSVDDNQLPLNPKWVSQTIPPNFAPPDPARCGPNPWEAPCTSQAPRIDNNTGLCPPPEGGVLGGHANWFAATYNGRLSWESHSLPYQDDDYSLFLATPDRAGYTTSTDAKGIEIEFSSDETIDHFHTPWWTELHAAVDDDDSRSLDNPLGHERRVMIRGTSRAKAILDGTETIVTGLLGLDCAHACHTELHPVYAMALHVKRDLDDDVWALFARNWGNEGYCSKGIETVAQNEFTFRLPWRPGATAVELVSSDLRWRLNDVRAWSFDPRSSEQAVLVTLRIADPSRRDRVHGEIHLKWTGGEPYRAMALTPQAIAAGAPEEEVDAESAVAAAVRRMEPSRRAALIREFAKQPVRPDSVGGQAVRSTIQPRAALSQRARLLAGGVVEDPAQAAIQQKRATLLRATRLQVVPPPDTLRRHLRDSALRVKP